MKKFIKWMIILGLVYIFVLWYVAQSPYRCDRVDHLPYLKLMCEKDKSKSEVEKKLFKELSGKVKYGDGKPTLTPLPAPTGNARDYPGDLPVLGPPSGIPSWCPPGEKKGSPPSDNERTECVY